ncbi:CoA transferase [Spongiibacter sp. KMU-166]|uniref:CoA transferase n=1 Tax=Spongiibacter thalassae TaxID=2721624 RepID=A0ABX1G9N7_9GAMM|nr:CoA transferase [Spongiibacter thalassae]NKI15875.1 CoA transferase [Spongiibacter thalassae]
MEGISGSAKGALNGVKVVDLSTVVFGPYGSQILGDLGAEVIKVEGGRGDNMRLPGNSPVPGMGPLYLALNRNKKSITLELKRPSALAAMKKLIEGADVFYTNVRMAGLERLGLGYEQVKAINPGVVYVHCTGFGTEGAYGGKLAYDDVVQAASGFSDLLPRVDGNDAPRYVPSLIADKTAGLHAAYATMAGLFHKQRTGEGQFIEVPMFETFTSFHMIENLYDHSFVPPRGNIAYDRSIDPNRRPFKTLDGYISIVPYAPEHWQIIMDFGGIDNILEDERFNSFEKRTKNTGILYGMVEDITKTKTTDEWVELMDEAGLPCMRVNRMEEVLDDKHLQEVSFFQKRNHPVIGEYLNIRHPVKFSVTPASTRNDAPSLGEHNEEILGGLGYSHEEISEIQGK